MPNRRHVSRRQSALAGPGLFARRWLFTKLSDELIERAGAGLGLVAERDGDLASGYAGIGLPLAESAYIGDGSTYQRHSFGSVDLRIRRRCFRAAWQQHAYDAQPKCHPQKKEHDPTHNVPGGLFAAFELKPSRQD